MYVVFAASTHHWQFRRRYCGCSLFTVLILFANNTHTAPHHLLAPHRFSPPRGKQSRIDRGWYCNLFHSSSNLMVDPSIAFLAVAKHWHSHAVACFLQGNVKKRKIARLRTTKIARLRTKTKGRTFADGIFIETLFLPKCNFATWSVWLPRC